MTVLKKLLIILFVLLLVSGTVILIIGYSNYSSLIREESLVSRMNDVSNMENFVPYSELPENYVNAVIAVEDHRYYEHGAIDIIGIGRALYTNLINFELQEGGSTITQQVAKNVILGQDQTFIRKISEIFAAFDLENNYSKEEILAFYVNSAYFGDGYYGIYDASMGYYNKEPKDLNLDEASMLAGVPNAPSVYAPTVNPDLAKQRQRHVLNKMVEYGYITQEEADMII